MTEHYDGTGLDDSSGARLREHFEALKEARMDWLINPRARRKAVWLCALMGGWGVLSGYAVFIKIWKEGDTGLWAILFSLMVAAAVAFIAETMREIIKHGRGDEEEEEDARPSSLVSSVTRSGPRVLVTILMLALFELFVTAWHKTSDLYHEGALKEISSDVLRPAFMGEQSPYFDLAVMIVLWVSVGALLAGVLAYLVMERSGRRAAQVRSGLVVGCLAGCLAAPLGVLLYILLMRTVVGITYALHNYALWNVYLDGLEEHRTWVVIILVSPIRALVDIGRIPYAGLVIVVSLLSILIYRSWKKRRWKLLSLLLLGTVICFSAPLINEWEELKGLLLLPVLAALIWSIPGAVLGMAVPYLKRPAEAPKIWGVVAFVAAALLLVLTFYRLADRSFLVAVMILLLAGVLLLRGSRIEDYWPLVALCIAMVICGATLILQQATFFGVLESVHAVNSLPPSAMKEQRMFFEAGRKLTEAAIYLPEDSQRYEAFSRRVEQLKNRPLEEQIYEAEGLLCDIELEKLRVVDRLWRSLEWDGSPAGHNLKKILDANDPALSGEIEGLSSRGPDEQLRKIDELLNRLDEQIAAAERDESHVHNDPPGIFGGLGAAGNIPPFLSPSTTAGETLNGLSALNQPKGRTPFKGRARENEQPQTHAVTNLPPWAENQKNSLSLGAAQSGGADCDYWFLSDSPLKRCVFEDVRRRLEKRGEYVESLLMKHEARVDSQPFSLTGFYTDDARRTLGRLEETSRSLAETEKALDEKKRWKEERVAQKLELSLTGSLGFWVTVGLLAGWSTIRHQKLLETGAGGDQRPRCFWACGALLDYHDRQHGVMPENDHQLFKRLSLELLINNIYWKQEALFSEMFADFVPEFVAEMSPGLLESEYLKGAKGEERKAIASNLPDGFRMVIENARLLINFYKEQASREGLDSSSATLLRDWQVRAQDEPDALVLHVRRFFQIRQTTPVGTFLQSVGLLPGAHFKGCAVNDMSRPSVRSSHQPA